MDLSIVLPVYNEEKNVSILYRELTGVISKLTRSYEIIFIDDGSSDGSYLEMLKLKKADRRVVIVKFRRNYGQTAAIAAGFDAACGRYVISMDSDLQDNPVEIPKLLWKLHKGYGAVCAWRYKRKDTLLKRFISKGARLLRKILTSEKVHDSGCQFRAYTNEAVKSLELYGEMHRAIPTLLHMNGFRVGEVKVSHRKRRFGKSKYNMKRVMKGFLDMLIVRFWMDYSARPIHLFGGFGLLSGFVGFLMGVYITLMKFISGVSADRPLLLLSVLMILLGFQSIMFGFVADITAKNYYKDKNPYAIEKIIK